MIYDIEKIKGTNRYAICHMDSREIINANAGDKKRATKEAARMNGVTVKEFLKGRK